MRQLRYRRYPTRRSGRRGFTLIEVVVAVVILVIMLGALMRVFSTGLRSVSAAEDHTIATLQAQSTLAAIGVETPLAEGEALGTYPNGFRWRAAVRPYLEADQAVAGPRGVAAYEVSVTVSWGGGAAERAVTLTTLRLGKAQ